MKNSTYRLVLFFLVSGLLVFNVNQVHTKPGAPPAGGVSGDPARTTCALIGCHPGPELSFSSSTLTLNMGSTQSNLTAMAGQTYVPGQTYFIEFNPSVTNGSNTKYGFQMTSLDASANMAGAFTITDAVNNSAQSLLSRNYIGHKDASAFHDWVFQWTAPSTNVGKITFYYTADDADGNGSTSGDKIYKGTTDLLPASSTGIGTLEANVSNVSVFPNPASEKLFVCFSQQIAEDIRLNLFSTDGRLVQSQMVDGTNGPTTVEVNLAKDIVPGIYVLQVVSGHGKVSKQVLVI